MSAPCAVPPVPAQSVSLGKILPCLSSKANFIPELVQVQFFPSQQPLPSEVGGQAQRRQQRDVTAGAVTVTCDPAQDPAVTAQPWVPVCPGGVGGTAAPLERADRLQQDLWQRSCATTCRGLSHRIQDVICPQDQKPVPHCLLPELCCSPLCLPWAILRQHLVATVPPPQRRDSASLQFTVTLQRMVLENQNLPSYITAN